MNPHPSAAHSNARKGAFARNKATAVARNNAQEETSAWDNPTGGEGGWHIKRKASSRAARERRNETQPPKLPPERRLEASSWTVTRVINTGKGIAVVDFRRVCAGTVVQRLYPWVHHVAASSSLEASKRP